MTRKRLQEPAKIFVITNQKGGVGKTTLAANLSYFFAEQDYKTLIIDLDPQGNLSSRFIPEADRINGLRSYNLFSAELPNLPVLTGSHGVDVIYSLDGDVEGYSIEQKELSVIRPFAEHVLDLADHYDIIIIDTAPAAGIAMTGAVWLADYIYVPVELAAFAVAGVRALLRTFTRIHRTTGKDIKPTGFICNKLNSRVDAHHTSLAELRSEIGGLIMRNSVNIRGAIDTSVTAGVPVWSLRGSGAEREAGKEMLALMEEIATQCGLDFVSRAKPLAVAKPARAPQKVAAKGVGKGASKALTKPKKAAGKTAEGKK